MNIKLTDEEREILNEILQGALTTLEVELHRTDDLRFKENLKRRCEVVEGLLAKAPLPVGGA
jgi:hypothetical protein